jgi:predicted transcriptional regulator
MMTLPTGNQLRAARSLVGLEQREVAKRAKVSIATLIRMEGSGRDKVRSLGTNIEAVLEVLRKAGVEITDDPHGVHLTRKR